MKGQPSSKSSSSSKHHSVVRVPPASTTTSSESSITPSLQSITPPSSPGTSISLSVTSTHSTNPPALPGILLHPVPHPDNIVRPTCNEFIQGFYVVTIGRQCGIFYTWYVLISFIVVEHPKILLCAGTKTTSERRGYRGICSKSVPPGRWL